MASTTITYGKKRGLVGSFGSRRRYKLPINPLLTKNPNPPSEAINPQNDDVKQNDPTQNHVHPASIEEIASALLDDSTISVPKDSAKRQSEMDPFKSFASTSPAVEASTMQAMESTNCSFVTTEVRNTAAEKAISARPNPPRIQKTSPKLSSARSPRARSWANSSPGRNQSGLLRPFVSPVDFWEDHSLPIAVREVTPGCVFPQNTMEHNTGTLLKGQKPPQIYKQAINSDGVQEKVFAMLAATDALKPSPVGLEYSTVPKTSRITPSRVFAKVSNAWDRLHVKTSTSGSTSQRKLARHRVQQDANNLFSSNENCSMSTARRASSINTIKIRLNEGDNLNRQKVQKMVGGRVTRKPVAGDGKSLRNGQSVDDPLAGPVRHRSLITNKTQPVPMTDNEPSVCPSAYRDPFESEKGFESNLEDRILNSSPGGASTPQIRTIEAHAAGFDDDNNNQDFSQPSGVNSETVTIKLTKYGPQQPASSKDSSDKIGNRRLMARRDSTNNILSTLQSRSNAPNQRWTKKHPSPSKKDLENLEEAFHWYSQLGHHGTGDDVDELARSDTPPARMLSPLDTNRLIILQGTAHNNKAQEAMNKHCNISSSTGSRISQPVLDLRNHSRIRLAPPYRSSFPQADETDELQ